MLFSRDAVWATSTTWWTKPGFADTRGGLCKLALPKEVSLPVPGALLVVEAFVSNGTSPQRPGGTSPQGSREAILGAVFDPTCYDGIHFDPTLYVMSGCEGQPNLEALQTASTSTLLAERLEFAAEGPMGNLFKPNAKCLHVW